MTSMVTVCNLTLLIIISFIFFVPTTLHSTMHAPLSEKDNGKTIICCPGEILELMLPSNPSTGYLWEVDGFNAKILHKHKSEFILGADTMGSGGNMLMRFEILNYGKTLLKIIYHRPFEKDVPPQSSFEVMILVEPECSSKAP